MALPAPGVTVRPARAGDDAARLVFEAAPAAYCAVAGSPQRARQILQRLWPQTGHSASFEHALVAELDGRLVGVLIGFPARDRYRLHFGLLRRGLRYTPVRRWPLLVVALPTLVAATPRPPHGAYYIGTIAVAARVWRRDIASTLGHHAEVNAAQRGFALIVAHTGTRHVPARHALEANGLRATKRRSWGYVLYEKVVAGDQQTCVRRRE